MVNIDISIKEEAYMFLESMKKIDKSFSDFILEFEKKKGKIIELFDCVIAGIFLTNRVNKIITKNVKHFENIKELNVMSY